MRTSRAPRALFKLSIACVPLIVIVAVFVSRNDSQLAREAIAVITFVLLMAVLGAIIGRMTIHLTISLATVLAGLCIYLLLGLVFSSVFSFLDAADSTPFFAQVPTASASDLLYFSFITMTTVGYGDLTPGGQPAPDAGRHRSAHGPDLPGDGGGAAGRATWGANAAGVNPDDFRSSPLRAL